ncbi:Copper Transporter (Ctr) Family [Trachipleistophora hominis]|uniref:Copper transport protein n=1 Tax=Trachipleistophora hominis TaxID=72359 RepID=L7JSV9_TRAHO|nr:Copper Transporter (Ctr) Family [Trachipleistophora hominis]
MRMACCGMSLAPKYEFEIKNFIIPSTHIQGLCFFVLLASLCLVSCINELVTDYINEKMAVHAEKLKHRRWKVYIMAVNFVTVFINFIMMMVCMTFNVWVVCGVILGKLIGRVNSRRKCVSKCDICN